MEPRSVVDILYIHTWMGWSGLAELGLNLLTRAGLVIPAYFRI